MENFDLLPRQYKNGIFRVSFDFYTPRPQFIIMPRDVEAINAEFAAMTAEQTCILLEAVENTLSCFRLPSAILSVHRGSWKSRAAKSFHCHLCVEVDQYLALFERKKKKIPDWPSVAYVTRQWVWNKDPRSYAQNVRGYPYKSTFKDDISAILQLIRVSIPQQGNPSHSSHDNDKACSPSSELGGAVNSHHENKLCSLFGCNVIRVVYHPSHPKIGFVGKQENSLYDLHEILWTMENYARLRGLTDTETEDKNYGCHLCLYFGPGNMSKYEII